MTLTFSFRTILHNLQIFCLFRPDGKTSVSSMKWSLWILDSGIDLLEIRERMISSLKCLADSSPNVSKIRPCSTGGRRVARGCPAASASICLAGGSGGRRVGSRCGAQRVQTLKDPHRRAFHRRRARFGLCGALEFATEVVREHRPQQPHLVGAAPTTREAGHLHACFMSPKMFS